MPQYSYQDKEDCLADTYEQIHEPYPGYAVQAENHALRRALKLLGATNDQTLLDAGCGNGRLLIRLAASFRRIIAFDPDANRAARAGDLVRRNSLGNVRVLCGGVETISQFSQDFDAVLCSHVIQHITTYDVVPLFRRLRSCLRDDGVLILLTSVSTRRADIFLKSCLTGANVISTQIDEDQFNTAVTNERHCLPVRMFASGTLLHALCPFFSISGTWYYGELSPVNILDSFIFRDRLINLPGIKGRLGGNVMIRAKRRPAGSNGKITC